MWTDNETTVDLLGFRVHADLIRSLVTDPSLLPITVGVFGDWGGGKTSLMRMLQEDLDPDGYDDGSEEAERYEKIACVYFNGWTFEGYDDAKAALISSVLLQLAENKRFGEKIRDKAKGLLGSVNWMRLAKVGFKDVALPAAMAYFTGGLSLLPSLASKAHSGDGEADKGGKEGESKIGLDDVFKFDQQMEELGVRKFRENFSELLDQTDLDSLVVLIDDLDRCSPQRIVENLEAIKLFLSVDRTAFVIGADLRIIRHAVATIYGDARDDDLSTYGTDIVEDYIEKLIQVPYRLPLLSPSEVETYMTLLFCHDSLSPSEFQQVRAAWQSQLSGDRYSVFGYSAVKDCLGDTPLPSKLEGDLRLTSRCASLITEGLKGNPRQVKRFLNAFVLRLRLANVAQLESIKPDVLAKLMVLEYAKPRQFEELYAEQAKHDGHPPVLTETESQLEEVDDTDLLELVRDEAEKLAKPFFLKWLKVRPRLAQEDLRDYFWIARDRLRSTLTDVSLVSPAVRRFFESLVSDSQAERQSVVEQVEALGSEELAALLEMIVQHTLRKPDEEAAYHSLIGLVESNLSGSEDALARLLLTVDKNEVPPVIGISLRRLQQRASPDSSLATALAELEESDVPAAIALQQKSKKKR